MKQKRGIFGMLGAGALAMLSLLPGMRPSGNMPMVNHSQRIAAANSQKQNKATPVQGQTNQYVKVEEIGGLPLISYMPNYGMSPKDYGIRYGNGGSKKSNRNRYAHNAKLKRRMA